MTWIDTLRKVHNVGFSRRTAEITCLQADIHTDHLSIVLEPEAASVYCKHMPSHQLSQGAGNKMMFKPNSKYMVIDLGGKCFFYIKRPPTEFSLRIEPRQKKNQLKNSL